MHHHPSYWFASRSNIQSLAKALKTSDMTWNTLQIPNLCIQGLSHLPYIYNSNYTSKPDRTNVRIPEGITHGNSSGTHLNHAHTKHSNVSFVATVTFFVAAVCLFLAAPRVWVADAWILYQLYAVCWQVCDCFCLMYGFF